MAFLVACVTLLGMPFLASAATMKQATSTPGMRALKQSARVDKIRSLQLTGAVNRPTLSRGSTGKDVQLLQKFLKAYGTYKGDDPDGIFGLMTESAARTFQRKESIIPFTGIVGPKTWARILEISTKEVRQNQSASSTPKILDATLSSDILENGAAATSTTSFASTTSTIYAIVTLENALQESSVSYIRFYKGTYVDSHVAHPSRNGLKYMHFAWALKDGASRPVGDYSISFYINGKKSSSLNFTVY